MLITVPTIVFPRLLEHWYPNINQDYSRKSLIYGSYLSFAWALICLVISNGIHYLVTRYKSKMSQTKDRT
ncbi:MAG: hypothetical protein VW397_02275 [Candidatus Margulisiibacteriota bacterium]